MATLCYENVWLEKSKYEEAEKKYYESQSMVYLIFCILFLNINKNSCFSFIQRVLLNKLVKLYSDNVNESAIFFLSFNFDLLLFKKSLKNSTASIYNESFYAFLKIHFKIYFVLANINTFCVWCRLP